MLINEIFDQRLNHLDDTIESLLSASPQQPWNDAADGHFRKQARGFNMFGGPEHCSNFPRQPNTNHSCQKIPATMLLKVIFVFTIKNLGCARADAHSLTHGRHSLCQKNDSARHCGSSMSSGLDGRCFLTAWVISTSFRNVRQKPNLPTWKGNSSP